MTTDKEKEYNRKWMRKHRVKQAWKRSLKKGHCPVCSMLLASSFHIDCPFLYKRDKETPF